MGKSYFSKVTDFYRSSHQGRSVKEGVLRKVFTKLTRKHLCQTGYFNKVCKPKTVKKRLRHKCFPLNVTKFVRTPFLQNTSGRLLLLLVFQKQPSEVFYGKRCSWQFCKIYRKTPVVCEIFRTLLDDYSWLFSATLPTMFGKPRMNTFYLQTLTLEVLFRYIIFFLAA